MILRTGSTPGAPGRTEPAAIGAPPPSPLNPRPSTNEGASPPTRRELGNLSRAVARRFTCSRASGREPAWAHASAAGASESQHQSCRLRTRSHHHFDLFELRRRVDGVAPRSQRAGKAVDRAFIARPRPRRTAARVDFPATTLRGLCRRDVSTRPIARTNRVQAQSMRTATRCGSAVSHTDHSRRRRTPEFFANCWLTVCPLRGSIVVRGRDQGRRMVPSTDEATGSAGARSISSSFAIRRPGVLGDA